MLVGLSVGTGGRSRTESSVEELGLLAQSAGATVVGSLIQQRARRDPATLIGRGKVGEVADLSQKSGADLLLFDDELSPAQQRNIEESVGRKTLDRTQLILDIFARRAPDPGGAVASGACPARLLAASLGGQGGPALEAGRRHRDTRSG